MCAVRLAKLYLHLQVLGKWWWVQIAVEVLIEFIKSRIWQLHLYFWNILTQRYRCYMHFPSCRAETGESKTELTSAPYCKANYSVLVTSFTAWILPHWIRIDTFPGSESKNSLTIISAQSEIAIYIHCSWKLFDFSGPYSLHDN